MDDAAKIVEFLTANMAHGFLVRDQHGRILRSSAYLDELVGKALQGSNANDILPGLRRRAGQYEIELLIEGEPARIFSVATETLADDSLFMDLLREIKPDRALRDRLVAEVQRMSKLAQTDSLTGLANRSEFDAELQRLIVDEPDAPFGVAVLDLDEFKLINDRFGHPAGDAALIEFASRLRQTVRDSDLVARLGGDEFAVLFAGARRDVAAHLVERLIEKLHFSMQVESESVTIHASVGWAHSEDGVDAILEAADRRMYLEKNRKRPL